MNKPRLAKSVLFGVAGLVVMLFATYVASYVFIARSDRNFGYFGEVTFRIFPSGWPHRLWYPIAWLDAKRLGHAVCLNHEDHDDPLLIGVRD